jgi:hypothetical protein
MSEEHSPSLREALEAAIAADAAPEAAPAPAPAPEAEGPARDEAGRFAAKEEAPAAPVVEDDYDEAVGLDRDTWNLTPAQARERAKALAKEAREATERANSYEPIDRVLSPRRDALRATWGDEGKAVEQLFHLSDWAGRDFPGFVRHLAQQQGYDLRALVPQQHEAQPARPAEPDIEALLDRKIQERDATRALQEFDRNTAYEFRTDPAVRQAMSGLLLSGAAIDIATAYDMATRALPPIAAKLAERERAAEAKRTAEERAKKASAAASAAVSVTGAPGTAQPAAPTAPATVRDALNRAMEMHSGSV